MRKCLWHDSRRDMCKAMYNRSVDCETCWTFRNSERKWRYLLGFTFVACVSVYIQSNEMQVFFTTVEFCCWNNVNKSTRLIQKSIKILADVQMFSEETRYYILPPLHLIKTCSKLGTEGPGWRAAATELDRYTSLVWTEKLLIHCYCLYITENLNPLELIVIQGDPRYEKDFDCSFKAFASKKPCYIAILMFEGNSCITTNQSMLLSEAF